jgi:hypothetical protein
MATKNEYQTKYSHLCQKYWNPAPQLGQPDWCTCSYCREMLEGEKVCCKENSERCHSRMPVNIIFSICLGPNKIQSSGKCQKNPYIINQNHTFSKNYCEVISG